MLPRWHILLGAIFSLIIYILFPKTSIFYILLIFLSSILIDFDHYVNAVIKTKKFSLKNAFRYHKKLGRTDDLNYKKGLRKKWDFELFHTVEFHAAVFALGFLWAAFFYIFIGMLFHSSIDIADMIIKDRLYGKEFSLIRWLIKKGYYGSK